MEVYYNKWIPAKPFGSDGAYEKGFPNKGIFVRWNHTGDMAVIKCSDNLEYYVPKEEVSFMDPRWDWEQRRYELAKAAMQGLLGNEKILSSIRDSYEFKSIMCSYAVEYADAMINQLQYPKP